MSHQYMDVCFSQEQADFREEYHRQLKHTAISTIPVSSVALAEAQATQSPYDFEMKYYQQSDQGPLFVVMAQAGT